MISALILSTMLGIVAAQQDHTLTVPLIGGDADTVAASVVSANSAATTLALACISTECGLFPAHTLVVGPSTYNVDMSDPNTDFTATQDCVIASSSAVCKETAGGSEANFPGSSTTTYEGTEVGRLTVTVTAGEEKLASMGPGVSESAAASQTSSQSAAGSATPSVTPAPGSGSATASSSASRTGSAATQASTGGAVVNGMLFGGGFVGAAAGVFGGLLL
ncbi:hypothetical protein C7974DRAFT_203301 [Boeremia exigua]|uniref:uncharacterized protein n=1 Tax=Boeremia exigua TaxID=749465 RepID=UPI001E8DC39C|nr:uncharacterized protein C7974DRAFT_203301 [Boeremia exigua]KAH6625588.1 hypothetical protein C7974DRAFT_203301 [Boeremia exigua]